MTNKTVLSDAALIERIALDEKFQGACQRYAHNNGSSHAIATAAMQAVLQSPEIQQALADSKRIDWLADPDNHIGNVQLPNEVVESNLHSLRDAIDAAMGGKALSDLDYWKECISIAAEECGLDLTNEQLNELAEGVSGGHEHYGMAFYSPPPSERISDIEDEWKRKLASLQAEFDAYRTDAETAVKQALRQCSDTNISIGKHGEVLRHDGRTEQIQ